MTLQLGYWDGRPWVQIVGVYAAAIQAFIHESFGDPMISAIDFGNRPRSEFVAEPILGGI